MSVTDGRCRLPRPARRTGPFSDLETGLGIASNLLSSRLHDLAGDGLVARAENGAYALTSLGEHTAGLILELSNLGVLFDPPAEPKRPGNLRTVYLPLQAILRAAPVRPELRARLVVDGESFTVRSSSSALTVHYRRNRLAGRPTVLSTSYEAIMAVSDGDITLDQFLDQLEIIEGPDRPRLHRDVPERGDDPIGSRPDGIAVSSVLPPRCTAPRGTAMIVTVIDWSATTTTALRTCSGTDSSYDPQLARWHDLARHPTTAHDEPAVVPDASSAPRRSPALTLRSYFAEPRRVGSS